MQKALVLSEGMLEVKITAPKAAQIDGCSQSIVKVETDAGITGYGEGAAPAP